jgi:hypothetical protein
MSSSDTIIYLKYKEISTSKFVARSLWVTGFAFKTEFN